MHKNITISDLNVEIQGKGNSIKQHLIAKIGICIIEFFLASILYCYGIFLSEYVYLGSRNYENGIWMIILYLCSWSFTDPVGRFLMEYFEKGTNAFLRYAIAVCAVLLFIAVLVPNNISMYMISGGMISNLISTQLNVFAIDKLDMDSKVFEANRQVARALSLFIMPQFVFWLVSTRAYNIDQIKLIFASILLNIIPAALIVKTDDSFGPETGEMKRYQTMGRYSYQMNEMKKFGKEDEDNKTETSSSSSSEEETPIFEINPQYLPTSSIGNSEIPKQALENNSKHIISLGIDNFGSTEHSVNDLAPPTVHLGAMQIQSYFFNVGVSILPGIPEENEDEETDDINNINSKRLSRISDQLERLNIRRDSIKEVFSINEVINENKPDPINKIEYIPNFREEKNRISVIDELKSLQKARYCFHCSPYRKYIWTRRLRMCKDFLKDNLLRPLYHAVKNLYFYPSLTTKVTTNLVSTLFITLAPFTAIKQSVLFSTENMTFLLTYVAFAWCFFLVGLPLVLKLHHGRIRIVFGFGLIVSGTSLWILSGKLTNDVITISSLLFGFGYGIISYTEKIVFKSSIGMRPWYSVRRALEVLSAVLILLIYYLIYFSGIDLNKLLFPAAFSYYINAIMWLTLPCVKYFTSIVKRIIFDERGQQEGFFH